MKKLISFALMIPAIIFLSSCDCSVSTAKIADVKVCTSLTGNHCDQDNTVITDNPEAIYASCLLKYAVANTQVKFTWYYYGQTKFEIDSVTLNTGEKSGNIELSSNLSRPNNGWPKGVYDVVIEVLIDNGKPVTKQFTVQ
jgi:hypothetical protein